MRDHPKDMGESAFYFNENNSFTVKNASMSPDSSASAIPGPIRRVRADRFDIALCLRLHSSLQQLLNFRRSNISEAGEGSGRRRGAIVCQRSVSGRRLRRRAQVYLGLPEKPRTCHRVIVFRSHCSTVPRSWDGVSK